MASFATNKEVGVKGKTYDSQAREIIANVLEFMKAEAREGSALIPLANFKARLLAATQIGENVYRRISKEAEDVASGVIPGFSTPGKTRKRKCPKTTLCEGEMESIRSIIHNYYIIEKRQPTLKDILAKIQDSGLSFNGSISTLSKVLKKIGFKWKTTADKRKILMETMDIHAKRIQYLKQLHSFQEMAQPEYIHSSEIIKRNNYKSVNKCETCPYFSKSNFSINNHLRRHHLPLQLFDCQRNDLELYYCTYCDFTFDSTIHLRKHVKEEHQIRENKVELECTLKSYICRVCSFETRSTLHWLKHRECRNGKV